MSNLSLTRNLVLATAVCFAAACASNQAEKEKTATAPSPVPVAGAPSAEAPLTTQDSILVSATATVQSINVATREVTLRGPLGNTISFTVDPRVKRLDEVKVGDEVTSQYYVSVAGELRPPTEAEKANPVAVVSAAARAPKEVDPAGGEVRAVKVVTTVEGIDLPTQTVTLKGPEGNCVTIRAKSLDNLKKLHVGDTIVVTYTEAVAISVEKTTPVKKEVR